MTELSELNELKEKIEKLKIIKNQCEGELKSLVNQYKKLIDDLNLLNLTPENLEKEIGLQREEIKILNNKINEILNFINTKLEE